MDLFKAQFERIQKQLSALTPSQKMLTAALAAIMIMTLVWWGRYAGEPELESLLPQSISADEIPRVQMALEARGIKHSMSGDKIMVPADRKVEALASLMYAHALPRNAKDAFDEVLKNVNPFMSQSQSDKVWNRGKELTISQIISDFPDVAEAHVMIDPTREVRIGGGVDPSATVTISTRSGAKAPQQLVDAVADVVQGAQSSLPRSKIKVVVDGIPRKLRQEDATAGLDADDQQEKIQKAEVHFEDKIKSQLSYIQGLMVAVTVKLNTTREETHLTTYDPKGTVSKETEIQSKTSETTGGAGSAAEAGVLPNVGLSVTGNTPPPAPVASGPTSNTEETTTKMQNYVGTTDTRRATPPGESTAVAAAVRIPLTYFAAMFQRENPGVKDPTEKQLRPLIEASLPSIRRDVMACTAIKSEGEIAIDTYFDPTPQGPVAPAATAGISIAAIGTGHVKEIVLGVLALVSLFMMSMVVKKGAPAPVAAVPVGPAEPTGPVTPPIIGGDDDIAGEVSSGESAMEGMELDDDAVKTAQMLDQVSKLVKENPDSAAALVKRWMNRT